MRVVTNRFLRDLLLRIEVNHSPGVVQGLVLTRLLCDRIVRSYGLHFPRAFVDCPVLIDLDKKNEKCMPVLSSLFHLDLQEGLAIFFARLVCQVRV